MPSWWPLGPGAYRRWFQNEYFDLFVWERKGEIERFQLAYDKGGNGERMVTWSAAGGFSHSAVDNSPGAGRYPGTPILVADGVLDFRAVAQRFRQSSADIDSRIADAVYDRLIRYPEGG